jgi:hypothetical protein
MRLLIAPPGLSRRTISTRHQRHQFERLLFRIEPTADFIEKYGETSPDSGHILRKLSNIPEDIEPICSVGTIAGIM